MILKNKKLIKVGDSWAITIDAAFIKNGQISLDKKYEVDLKEIQN